MLKKTVLLNTDGKLFSQKLRSLQHFQVRSFILSMFVCLLLLNKMLVKLKFILSFINYRKKNKFRYFKRCVCEIPIFQTLTLMCFIFFHQFSFKNFVWVKKIKKRYKNQQNIQFFFFISLENCFQWILILSNSDP